MYTNFFLNQEILSPRHKKVGHHSFSKEIIEIQFSKVTNGSIREIYRVYGEKWI